MRTRIENYSFSLRRNDKSFDIILSGELFWNPGTEGSGHTDAIIKFEYRHSNGCSGKLTINKGSKLFGRDANENKEIAMEIKSFAAHTIQNSIIDLLTEFTGVFADSTEMSCEVNDGYKLC